MISAVIGVFGVVAVAAWFVAAYSALMVVANAPRGRGFAAYWDLGWWRHSRIVQRQPAAAPHLARFRKALAAFFCCIFAAMAIGFLLALAAQNGGEPG